MKSPILDDKIFKFLNPTSNDRLSNFKGYDLKELVDLIDDCYIQLRRKLGLEKYITFGLELEFEQAMNERIKNNLKKAFLYSSFKPKHDGSLTNGAEIATPILTDKDGTWSRLNKVCSIVRHSASILENAGGHVHVGKQVLGENADSWINLLSLWSAYENIIFRFLYGEFLTARPLISRYAEPMSQVFWNIGELAKRGRYSSRQIIFSLPLKKNNAINFCNINILDSETSKNTIEFRCPNGSLEAPIWQNNVNCLIKMMLCSRTSKFDLDTVQRRYCKNGEKFYYLETYDRIYLHQALEFCDLVFKNNLDKIYFLRQYLKSFKIYNKGDDYLKKCVLTKKI